MIIEDYVSFETAKLLKEKGFDAEIHMYWCAYTARPEEGYIERCPEDLEVNNDCSLGFRPDDFECIAPTLQMAMKWLREVHNLHFWIGHAAGKVLSWYYEIHGISDGKVKHIGGMQYGSYEVACEAAIKCCLENLI